MKARNYYPKVVAILKELNKLFPSYNIGKHLSTATDGQDMWGISDKALYLALVQYKAELETNNSPDTNEYELQKILEDGMHLEDIFEEEEY